VTKIKGFGDDSLVVHIGDFFRYNGVPDWSVTLWCRPIHEKKYTKLANLPLLSRGKLLNSTAPNIRRADRVITFKQGYQFTVSAFFKIVVAQSCFKQPLSAPARVSRAAPDLASRHR
jgi:hypothetical protein